ncbi:MAG: CBS domain-containing protein [Lewinellaceae bacterium]|nr:CBS domain-containing protein [Phaeodactylibacter sp.]MCB9349193.1 CBS domain-containing protein [Lewinellaceae bacterium]
MENTIPRRVYDFLKEFPPFNLLGRDLLMRISERVLVQYRQPGDIIFRQGDPPNTHIYIVREGAVHLLWEKDGEPALVEQCDEGDVFGIRPLLAEENYALTAKVVEESLIYAINVEGFREVLENNPKVAFYLASTFASGVGENYRRQGKPMLFLDQEKMADVNYPLVEVQSLEKSKDPVTCLPDTFIREAAVIMSRREVGSVIVVDEASRPLGIVTDKDLRSKVATGQVGLEKPVAEIMSSPVITVGPDITVADVQIEMVKNRINHLCITEDGTSASPVIGVLSEHDLMVVQGNNPALLIREIRRCRTGKELRHIRERAEDLMKKYIYQEVAIAFISTVMSEVNDELITQSIKLSQAEMDEEGYERPSAGFCWLALGSEGRQEQLLRTDQDNALIFENVPEADLEPTKKYYLKLAEKATHLLNEVGYDFCPGDMMASNPSWCLSLEQWKAQFSTWIFEPSPKAVMYCTIFFDYRPIYGMKELATALTEHIFENIGGQAIFLGFLAKDALQNPPPLTFFRNFVVENGGEHKDEFDIKARAMMPLADAARVLILDAKVGKINNTFRRFEKLAELEPINKELYEQAADAYEILMRYRALQGLKNKNSGRYFNPSELSKMERVNLRNCFQPIKELQTLLTLRYQLAYLG